jgi:hypothetical protein
MAVHAVAIVFTAGETGQLYNSPAQVGFLSVFISPCVCSYFCVVLLVLVGISSYLHHEQLKSVGVQPVSVSHLVPHMMRV